MRRPALSVTAMAVAAGLAVGALSGCSSSPSVGAQHLTIAYADEGSAATREVEVRTVNCTETQGLRTFVGGEDVNGRAAVTVSILGGEATVAIHLDDDRWFVSSGATDAEEQSATFDGFTGSIVEQGDDLDILGIVDDAATLSGTLRCG